MRWWKFKTTNKELIDAMHVRDKALAQAKEDGILPGSIITIPYDTPPKPDLASNPMISWATALDSPALRNTSKTHLSLLR